MIKKFEVIKNFLTPEELNILKKYMEIKHRFNDNLFDRHDNRCVARLSTKYVYDPVTESLLFCKKQKVESLTNLKLFNSYSCWRVYTKHSFLKSHTDRPPCEISVTIMIGSDGTPWPIFMDGQPVELQPGEACLYKGTEVEHSREEFLGDWQSQIFLHYVDQNGPYANYKLDGRTFLGQTRNLKNIVSV